MTEHEVMSVTEAARFLRRRTQDVLDGVAAGRIPSLVIGSKRRVLRSSLLAWLHAQEQGGERGPGVSIQGGFSGSYLRKRGEPTGRRNGRF